ncbi:MAG: hypothetical protein CMF31_03845 [Kordiimonas sp.]|nr:hypothetical protein [Kordiimonas sp.]|tara:strand:- start:1818 stop:2381 length:564 start_codon:yes stop_codon:yes gene_type:complete
MTINRLTWMKLHGYIAVFFLPLALLYVLTGTLYLVDVKGDAEVTRFPVETITAWPETGEDAEDVMTTLLEAKGLSLPGSMVKGRPNDYFWLGLRSSAHLSLKNDPGAEVLNIELVHQEYDLMRSMVEIHKGHAGLIFRIMGIIFGVFLTTVLVTGAVLSLKSVAMRQTSYWAFGSGLGIVILGWVLS